MTTGYPDDWDRRRKRVLARDHYQCIACGATGGPRGDTELHVDHVRPKARGGGHGLDNLQTLCRRCHDEKHGFEVADDPEPERPVGVVARLERASRSAALSTVLGVTQVVAAWVLALATTTNLAGLAATVVAGLVVVGATLGVEWRPGHLPGFAVGVAVPLALLHASGGVVLGDLLSSSWVLAEPSLSGDLRPGSPWQWPGGS